MRRAFLAFLLSVVILPSEAQNLATRDWTPAQKQLVAKVADGRAVILSRAPYAVYGAGVTGQPTIMSFVFPSYALEPGDMVRVQVFGVAINNNAGATSFGISMQSVQNGAVNLGGRVSLSVPPAVGNPNNYVQYRAEFLFSVGVPNAPGNYVPNISANAVTTGSTFSSGLQPFDALSFYGAGWGFVTDFATSGAVVSGGALVLSSGALGLQRPAIYQNSIPIELDVQIANANFTTMPITVSAGVMEGL